MVSRARLDTIYRFAYFGVAFSFLERRLNQSMNGTAFSDDDCAPIPLWAKDYPKTWLVYMVVDHILWLEHEALDIQRIFQESKMFFKDHTLLEDPLSKGFPIPGLLKQIRERARVGDLLGPSYYQVQLT